MIHISVRQRRAPRLATPPPAGPVAGLRGLLAPLTLLALLAPPPLLAAAATPAHTDQATARATIRPTTKATTRSTTQSTTQSTTRPTTTTGTIVGTVRATPAGTPLAGIIITLPGIGKTAVSDPRGHFRLADIPAGTYTLRAERIGLATLERSVVVRPDTVVHLDLELAEIPLELGDLVISVDREIRRRAETAATINVVDDDAIRATRATHPSDLLAQVPGAWVNTTGGEGHMTAIRHPQTTAPVYLYLEDGVPTRSTGFFNHNALYELNLPLADRIEVVKGPATALHGSDAIGATINVGTRAPSPEPTLEGSLEAGAHGWARLLFSASATPGQDGLRAGLNITRTDGWRDGTAYDRQSGSIRWDRPLAAATSLKTVAAFSLIDQSTAGSSALAREDFRDRPRLNYTPISFRKVRALRLSTELRHATPSSLLTLTAFARDNWMEVLPNWSLTYDPTTYTNAHRSLGLMAIYRIDLAPLATRLVMGLDLDRSPGRHLERVVIPHREGRIFADYDLGSTIYDYDVVFLGLSPYLQATMTPTERLHITAGLRYDDLGYSYATRLAPLDSGRHRRPADTAIRYRHLSPKLGATYEITTVLNLFAAYGHGFRAPSEGQLFRQGQALNSISLRPVRVDSYEAGFRGTLGTTLRFELAAYLMDKYDDIMNFTHPDGSTENLNAGRTRHRGFEMGAGLDLTHGLRLDIAYAYARHSYLRWRPRTDQDLGGQELEQAPRHLTSATLGFAPRGPGGANVALETRRIGSYWMDPQNTARYDGHTLLALRGEVPLFGALHLFGRISNLLDTRFAEIAAYTAARGEELAPGLPRTINIGIQYRREEGR